MLELIAISLVELHASLFDQQAGDAARLKIGVYSLN